MASSFFYGVDMLGIIGAITMLSLWMMAMVGMVISFRND